MDTSSMHHPDLGILEKREDGFWHLEYRFADSSVTQVSISDEVALPDALSNIVQLLARIDVARDDIKSYIAQSLTPDHNDGWNEDGAPISQQQFADRIGALEGITVWEPDSAEVYHQDGGLFWGHVLIVDISANGTLAHARFEG